MFSSSFSMGFLIFWKISSTRIWNFKKSSYPCWGNFKALCIIFVENIFWINLFPILHVIDCSKIRKNIEKNKIFFLKCFRGNTFFCEKSAKKSRFLWNTRSIKWIWHESVNSVFYVLLSRKRQKNTKKRAFFREKNYIFLKITN